MLKMPITYQDLDGNSITEMFYFGLNVTEVAEMEVEYPGGLEAHLKSLIEAQNGSLMVSAFKKIMQKAYGKRSEDGKRFVKSEEAWKEFTETDAFGVLFFDLLTDAKKNADFIVGILPGDFNEKMAKITAMQTVDLDRPGGRAIAEGILTEEPENPREKRLSEYTDAELLMMPEGDFDRLIKKNKGNVPYRVLQIGMQRRLRE